MIAARTPCCVPFCRRGTTRAQWGEEIICGDHYRMTDASLRRKRSRVRARLRKRGELDPGSDGEPLTERAWRLDCRFWAKIKRQAIERAAGVSA